ncbi:uncharacterized protein JCM15063_005467 [Sporobolomyces koalae]|uniref:uncharacterized protein n=1 Tax=Sporobolomyces koalae TaxID=500713 RepID=UPI00317D13F7
MSTLFFYGTLAVPAVLERVLRHDRNDLVKHTRDAVLRDHVRLHVKGEDYPALVSRDQAEQVIGTPLQDEHARVQGVIVSGISVRELALLDEFEGDEYVQTRCTPVDLQDPSKEYPDAICYRWTASLSRLSPKTWTLVDFLRDASHRWLGPQGEKEYVDVDRKRDEASLDGPTGIAHAQLEVINGSNDERDTTPRASTGEKFGKQLRERYWNFEEGWTNINHGSYGSAPTPVVDSFLAIRDRIDRAPDRMMRLEYETLLLKLRTQLSEFVDCDTRDLVIVANATMGVNTALHSLTNEWQKHDRLLYFDTSIYHACKLTLDHIVNTHPHLELSLLPVTFTYPISHQEILEKTRKAIEDAEQDGTSKVRLALVDGISSNPGVIVPWEQLCELFKKKDVISLVDAAHNIGQLPVSLRTSRPDFWISNCHKWLLAHRGCAVLYVDKRFQHLVHSIPTSHFYAQRTPENASEWSNEFVWTGTLDWSPVLSTLDALEFRRDVLGGEQQIRQYCHDLAIRGGEKVAEILGTRTMRNETAQDGELVANMINIELPLPSYTPFGSVPPLEGNKLQTYWWRTLIEEFHTAVPIFPHAGLPWIRLSAQVYIDFEDFVRVGNAIKEVCERIERGEHLQDPVAKQGTTGAEPDE